MHRVPIWGAISILLIQLFVYFSVDGSDYIIDKEYLGITIGVNIFFIVVPLIWRAIKQSESNAAVSNVIMEQRLNEFMSEHSSDENYIGALHMLQNSPSEEQVKVAISILSKNAQLGHRPSIEILQELNSIVSREIE